MTSDYFVTLRLNFTSWVVGTVPLTMATARTMRSLRPPGAASAGAFSTSVASSLPAGITTSAAVTSFTAAGGTRDTLNSPAKSHCRATLTTTSTWAPALSAGFGVGSVSTPTVRGSTVIVSGADGSTRLMGVGGGGFMAFGSRTNGTFGTE